jgi:hypothetical protein
VAVGHAVCLPEKHALTSEECSFVCNPLCLISQA